jgi:hypothetical protein
MIEVTIDKKLTNLLAPEKLQALFNNADSQFLERKPKRKAISKEIAGRNESSSSTSLL